MTAAVVTVSARAERPAARWWQRVHSSVAEEVLDGVDTAAAWRFLRNPRSAMVLLPDVVDAGVVHGDGVGERIRYVCREGRRETVSVVEVTALEPGRLIELTLLGRPYDAVRRFELTPVGDSSLLTVRTRARAGWSWIGMARMLQEDDDEYVRRAAQVLAARALAD